MAKSDMIELEGTVVEAVSYTHLDVYKRQAHVGGEVLAFVW